MKRRELLLTTLHRVTNQQLEHLVNVVEKFISITPDERNMLWDDELEASEQVRLQEQFKDEASGTVAWYARVLMDFDELCLDRVHCIQKEHHKKFRNGRRS